MLKKLFIVLFAVLSFSSVLFAQSTKFRFDVQLCPELHRYSSNQINPTTSVNETSFKTAANFGVAANGYISLNDRIWINIGICYVERAFSTVKGFNQFLHAPKGEVIPYIYIMTNKQDYYFLEYPLGFTIYLRHKGSQLEPKLIGNIIGKQLIKIKCDLGSDSFTEKQNQFYGIASNFGIGLDYHLSESLNLEFNCLYRFYNSNREQPILYGDNGKYFNDNNGILNFAIGLEVNIIRHKP